MILLNLIERIPESHKLVYIANGNQDFRLLVGNSIRNKFIKNDN